MLYAAVNGYLLRVGRTDHHVHLEQPEADALLDALVTGTEPTSTRAQAALDWLVGSGLVDVGPPRWTVRGNGTLAEALRVALERMGAEIVDNGRAVAALDDEALPDVADAGRACWITGHLVVLAPADVPARDVAARHRAATRHRDTDPRLRPAPGGRRVAAPPSTAGLELAAVVVAADLLAPSSSPRSAVAIDLHSLTVTRHPVLPVPTAPR